MSFGLIELFGSDILGSIEGGEEVRLPAAPAIATLSATAGASELFATGPPYNFPTRVGSCNTPRERGCAGGCVDGYRPH
jgi:hypothetical protein